MTRQLTWFVLCLVLLFGLSIWRGSDRLDTAHIELQPTSTLATTENHTIENHDQVDTTRPWWVQLTELSKQINQVSNSRDDDACSSISKRIRDIMSARKTANMSCVVCHVDNSCRDLTDDRMILAVKSPDFYLKWDLGMFCVHQECNCSKQVFVKHDNGVAHNATHLVFNIMYAKALTEELKRYRRDEIIMSHVVTYTMSD